MILRLPSVMKCDQLETTRLMAMGHAMSTALLRLADIAPDPVPDRWFDVGEGVPDRLIDDLSDYVCPSNERDPETVICKMLEEAALIGPATEIVEGYAEGRYGLAAMLLDISALVYGQLQPFRDVPAGIVADSQGRRLLFPDPADSRKILFGLDSVLRSKIASSYTLASVLAMVGLIHAHPFCDGNGRIARILFAAILRWGSGRTVNVPVLALQCLSYPSFLVRTRRAQCSGDWEPIVDHMIAALDLSRSLQMPQSGE